MRVLWVACVWQALQRVFQRLRGLLAPQVGPGPLHVPVAAVAGLALLAGTGQVVVDPPGGYVHGQAWGDMVEHIVPVLQRGHAHLGAAQGLWDVLQREAVGAGRCQAQRGREQCLGHMGDQAAVVVLHGALRQCGGDFVSSDVADVVDVGLQRGVLQRIGAQPVRHIAQRGAALHGMQGQGWGQ
jgi:hypothetical protein